MAAKFDVFVYENHDWLFMLYWLSKLHKRPYESRFFNSSSCTTTELSVLLSIASPELKPCNKVL